MDNQPTSGSSGSAALLERIATLTAREDEVLGLVMKGLSNEQIALTLFRSPKTVDKHCQRIFRKLGVHRRVSLVKMCLEAGYQPSQSPGGPVHDSTASVAATGPKDEYELVNDLVSKSRAMDRLIEFEQRVSEIERPEYFGEAASALCHTFGVAYAGITEIDLESNCGVMIAYSKEGELVPEMPEYILAGTPCEHTVRDGVYHMPDGLSAAFPEDQFLVDRQLESYKGVRLDDRKLGPIGLVWLCDTKPTPPEDRHCECLKMIAPGIAARLGAHIGLDQPSD